MTQTALEALETYFAIEDMARKKVSDRTLYEISERRKELRQALTANAEPVGAEAICLCGHPYSEHMEAQGFVTLGACGKFSFGHVRKFTSAQTPDPAPPAKPTSKMIDAGIEFARKAVLGRGYGWADYIRDIYLIMLRARPEAEAAPEPKRTFFTAAVLTKMDVPGTHTLGTVTAIVHADDVAAAIEAATKEYVAAGFTVENIDVREIEKG